MSTEVSVSKKRDAVYGISYIVNIKNIGSMDYRWMRSH